jgi:hypothetical protein
MNAISPHFPQQTELHPSKFKSITNTNQLSSPTMSNTMTSTNRTKLQKLPKTTQKNKQNSRKNFFRYFLSPISTLRSTFYVGQLKIIPLHHIPHDENRLEISVDNYDFFHDSFDFTTSDSLLQDSRKKRERKNSYERFAVNQVERLNIFSSFSTMFTGLTSQPQMLNCRNVIH